MEMDSDKSSSLERDLISGASGGDDSAFGELLKRYAPLIGHEISRFRSCGLDEDDLRQEAYIAFYHAVKTYRTTQDGVSFGLYAKICIKNRLLGEARVLRRSFPPAENTAREENTADPDRSTDASDPSVILISREQYALLRQLVSAVLSSYERTVFSLYIDGFSVSEIAVFLAKSERSISNALFRIRAKLKSLLN